MHLIYTHPSIGQPRPPISHPVSSIPVPLPPQTPSRRSCACVCLCVWALFSFPFSVPASIGAARSPPIASAHPPASRPASPPRASPDARPPTAENIAPLRRRRFFQTLHPSRDRLFCRSASGRGARPLGEGRCLIWGPSACWSGLRSHACQAHLKRVEKRRWRLSFADTRHSTAGWSTLAHTSPVHRTRIAPPPDPLPP